LADAARIVAFGQSAPAPLLGIDRDESRGAKWRWSGHLTGRIAVSVMASAAKPSSFAAIVALLKMDRFARDDEDSA